MFQSLNVIITFSGISILSTSFFSAYLGLTKCLCIRLVQRVSLVEEVWDYQTIPIAVLSENALNHGIAHYSLMRSAFIHSSPPLVSDVSVCMHFLASVCAIAMLLLLYYRMGCFTNRGRKNQHFRRFSFSHYKQSI